ncbi:MAG: DUF3592 domain-containing protein, partial [Pirellulales bacterium]|nr:DUF3592 domain-containing protein [Pirellulales bacterium]
MSRSFRVYAKKRGNRRTGSGRLGGMGEMVFFSIFFLAGWVGLGLVLVTLVVPEWRANHEFVETICVVRGKEIGEKSDDDGKSYRPEIQIEYTVGGRTYVTKTYDVCGTYTPGREPKEAILDQYRIGGEYPCWYDPTRPDVAVLVRGYSWWFWLIGLVPISFILIGGIGLVYRLMRWGKSPEHLAAEAARHRPLEPDAADDEADFPNVPPGADMTNSPGTQLRYRLPISTSAVWTVVIVLLVCLFWNGIVATFLVPIIRGHLAGRPEWFPTLFLIPFILVGLGLIFFFFRQLLVATGVGPTLLEISDHPLRPGRTYQVFLSQAGRLRLKRIRVLLVCEETARYREGTDTRTETQRVWEQELCACRNIQIQHGLPLEDQCEFCVPPGAMHSFESDNNGVAWKLVV